jgi:hypothetical protein
VATGSGEPLARTEVRLSRVLPEGTQRPYIFGVDPEGEGLPIALTESDGKFLLKDIEPGQYRLTASRNGYAEQLYGQKGSSGSGTVISLIAGEWFTNLIFRLVPAGVITGRVRDASGEPVPGVDIGLLKVSFNGERPYLFPADSARTDDRGEYRFYWIPPGRYYLRVARSQQQQFSNRRVVFDKTSAIAAFYPGVVDPSTASAIDLTPGAEISGIDITIPRASGHKISGRIVDGSTGKAPEAASVGLDPRKTDHFELGFQGTKANTTAQQASLKYVMFHPELTFYLHPRSRNSIHPSRPSNWPSCELAPTFSKPCFLLVSQPRFQSI